MDIIKKQKNNSIPHQKLRSYNSSTNHKLQTLEEYLEYKNNFTNSDNKNSSRKHTQKIFWLSVIFFILTILFAIGLFVYKTNATLNQMNSTHEKQSFVKTVTSLANPQSYKTLKGFSTGRINILLLGRANSHKAGKDLTDTIMMLSINTSDYTVGLFSIPRDFLVNNGNYYVKINSLYQAGLRNNVGAKYIIQSVEKITGQQRKITGR